MTDPTPSTTKTEQKVFTVEDILKIAAEVSTDPLRFKVYFDDPVGFTEDVLGVQLWEKQKEALELAVNNRAVSIRSGHGTGKTVVATCLALWWLFARRGYVVTTAPSKEHVEDVLWKEINMRFRNALVPLPGDCFKTMLKITPDWYAVGITTDQPDAFRGRHHPYLLVIVDEASGVSELIHEEIATLTTGSKNCRFMIANPTTLTGTFYDSHNTPGIWKTLHISCLDHPNVVSGQELIPGAVTREWVEEIRQKHGEDSPYWYSRVLGQFPKTSSRGIVPFAYIEKCIDDSAWKKELERADKDKEVRVGGLDVARYGENSCVLAIRRGNAIEHMEKWSHASLMETTGRAVQAFEKWGIHTLVVDSSGIGSGVVDRLMEQNFPVLAYNGGHRAFTPSTFSNRRTELWWALRTRFEKKKINLRTITGDRHDLVRQLVQDLIAPTYKINSSGRIAMQSKDEMLDNGFPSPDVADAVVMCFAVEEDPMAFEAEVGDVRKDSPKPIEPIMAPGEQYEFGQLPAGF